MYVFRPLGSVPSNPLTKNVRGKWFEDSFFHMDSRNCSRVAGSGTLEQLSSNHLESIWTAHIRLSEWYGGTSSTRLVTRITRTHPSTEKYGLRSKVTVPVPYIPCYCSRVRGNSMRNPPASSVNTHAIVRGYAYRYSNILNCSRIRNCSREQ